MASKLPYLRRRLQSTYLSATFSMTLLLFILGLFAFILYSGTHFARQAKSSILLKVFLQDPTTEYEKNKLMSTLNTTPYVAALHYVSKEEAGEILLERTGEDVTALLGGINPLMASINIQLRPTYIQADSLIRIKEALQAYPAVAEVVYPADMILAAGKNIRLLSLILGLAGAILVGVALYVILATIRLAIYARRLSIRSMQLVGATRNFIRRPFLLQGTLQGLISGLLAVGLVLMTLYLSHQWLKDLGLVDKLSIDINIIGLFAGIVLFGTILGFSGSLIAVNKYLDKRPEELI